MGNNISQTPITTNTCTDVGEPETVNVEIEQFCQRNYDNYDISYCKYYGGTYSPGNKPTNNTTEYDDPEWSIASTDRDTCNTDSLNPPNNWPGGLCGAGHCPIIGQKGYCSRVMNSGDPLICALRDFQCNGMTELSNPACFSDNALASTCSKDFRAADTQPSLFLLNQFCLGNIPGAIADFNGDSYAGYTGCTGPVGSGCSLNNTFPTCGGVVGCSGVYIPGGNTPLPFYSLWTDSSNPNYDINSLNTNWRIMGTPSGTIYRSSDDINLGQKCDYDSGGAPFNCQVSIWEAGQPGAPSKYLPSPDTYTFSGVPCQQIFWRTLYGNQPVFRNNFYKSADSINTVCANGSDICENTSIPPQDAACGMVPFGGIPTPGGVDNAKFLLTQAIDKYYAQNLDLTNNMLGIPAFNNFIFNVCQKYPYLCGEILQNKICSNYSLESIKFNPEALKWCGCYLPLNEYNNYSNNYGISKECTPVCNRPDVIPSYDPETNLSKFCNQSVCIIDDVTITLARTTLENEGLSGGNLNFNQICNSCSSNNNNGVNSNTTTSSNSINASTTTEGVISGNASINCQCILNNFTLTTVGSSIEGGVNISQACNGNAKCYTTGSTNDGTLLETSCHGSSTSQNGTIKQAEDALIKKAKKTSNYWVILFGIILIAMIIIAWLIIAPRGIPEKDLIYTKRFNLPKPAAAPAPVPVFNNLQNTNKAYLINSVPKKFSFY